MINGLGPTGKARWCEFEAPPAWRLEFLLSGNDVRLKRAPQRELVKARVAVRLHDLSEQPVRWIGKILL
jgi:hypothetical protein